MKHLCPRIDDLEQYSRDNCLLKFSGISQNSDQKKTTDEILNVVNKVVLSTRLTQQSLEIPILLELWDPRRITQRRHSTSRQVHRSRHGISKQEKSQNLQQQRYKSSQDLYERGPKQNKSPAVHLPLQV